MSNFLDINPTVRVFGGNKYSGELGNKSFK
jgi:hypothetical protein